MEIDAASGPRLRQRVWRKIWSDLRTSSNRMVVKQVFAGMVK
jgi:hypothetical protein